MAENHEVLHYKPVDGTLTRRWPDAATLLASLLFSGAVIWHWTIGARFGGDIFIYGPMSHPFVFGVGFDGAGGNIDARFPTASRAYSPYRAAYRLVRCYWTSEATQPDNYAHWASFVSKWWDFHCVAGWWFNRRVAPNNMVAYKVVAPHWALLVPPFIVACQVCRRLRGNTKSRL